MDIITLGLDISAYEFRGRGNKYSVFNTPTQTPRKLGRMVRHGKDFRLSFLADRSHSLRKGFAQEAKGGMKTGGNNGFFGQLSSGNTSPTMLNRFLQ